MKKTDKSIPAPESFREIAGAFQRARIFLTAYELDIFTAIGEGSNSAGIAKKIKADVRATDRLLNALCAMGIITKKKDMFYNTAASADFLSKDGLEYMGGLSHTAHLWHTWSTLTDAVRAGRSVFKTPIGKRGEEWLTGFIAAMHERAHKTAPHIAALIDFSGVSKILDVGGGSAAYSMAFVKANKGLKATIFDLPEVVPITTGYIKKEKLSKSIDTTPGDYNKNTFGTDLYDMIFLSAIIHINSPLENEKLIARCARALRKGGRVVVLDFIMDDDRTSPAFAAFFALNMLVGTDSGDTYTRSEVAAWMKKAGLSKITKKETPFGTSLITGKKAA